MLAKKPAFLVIERLSQGQPADDIYQWCSGFYKLPIEEATRFVNEIREVLDSITIADRPRRKPGQAQTPTAEKQPTTDNRQLITHNPQPTTYNLQLTTYNRQPTTAKRTTTTTLTHHYSINQLLFRIEFGSPAISYFIHPQFAHLETDQAGKPDHHFRVYEHRDIVVFEADGQVAGEWIPEEFISLLGKFYVEILNRIHHLTGDDWMAILHASAVSDGRSGLVFLGEVGHGKSTLSALLMAEGFDLYADDFTPVDVQNGHIWYFPAALSVKHTSWKFLSTVFPRLENAPHYDYHALNKKVRYLAPSNKPGRYASSVPVRALVFVRYKKGAGLRLTPMPKTLAFQKLIPGAWISPEKDKAERFLDWFLSIPCYRLTYSDNFKMIEAVKELL